MTDNNARQAQMDQIGQLFMVGFSGPVITPEIQHMIRHYRVGGIILFSRNIQHPQQILELTHALQQCARDVGYRYPLFIAIDQENGMVRRIGQGITAFPGNMALGATRSEQLTYEVAKATGQELKALGINMNLAPSVDVNNNAANPVIGVRSFGEDPELVARLGAAAVRGYHDSGIVATLKHFPGHGDTSVDSHLSLPVIPYDLERLQHVELVPFQRGIAAGAGCIMTAHIYFPALVGSQSIPATIAPQILQGLLREQLGYQGVIITDCLEMDAIAQGVGIAHASVATLQAGADIVLISHRFDRQQTGVEAVYTAVETGAIGLEQLARAAKRVQELKERFLSWDIAEEDVSESRSEEHQHLSVHAYDQAVTLVRDAEALLPLREPLWVVVPQVGLQSLAEDRTYPYTHLATSLQQYHEQTRLLLLPADATEEDLAFQQIDKGAIVVVITASASRRPEQAALVNRLLETGRRVIGVATTSPYDLQVFPQLSTYLTTYEYTQPALEAVARVLVGKISAQGQLPVTVV